MKVEKLKPIFDGFQGCFDDKCRFFAGLYFLYRIIFVCAFSLIDVPLASLAIAQVVVMIMTAVHLKFQPYRKKFHNNIDGCLFLLLGMINILTLIRYVESISQSERNVMILTGYIQLFFVYLPIFIFIFLLCSLAIKKHCKQNYHDINSRKSFLTSFNFSNSRSLNMENSHEPSTESYVASTSYYDMDIIKNTDDTDDDVNFRDELQVLDP
uniref:TRP C-terminal domain-containing protein n=1 Tax=Amphimedon queenslandica TaxID=400682 RepID=A0A1X7VCB6_AMPQE